mgnify:CR=1 FL=1
MINFVSRNREIVNEDTHYVLGLSRRVKTAYDNLGDSYKEARRDREGIEKAISNLEASIYKHLLPFEQRPVVDLVITDRDAVVLIKTKEGTYKLDLDYPPLLERTSKKPITKMQRILGYFFENPAELKKIPTGLV